MKIKQYTLDPAGYFSELFMPDDSVVLSVGIQNDDICLWAQVPPEAPMVQRVFVVMPTGEKILTGFEHFIGTVFMDGLAFHIFE